MATSIRLATDADVPAITDLYRPIVETTAISFETEPPGEDEMRRRIHDTLTRYPWLVLDRDGEIGGYAYATQHRVRAAYQWSVDTSIFVHPSFRRSGVGHGLYASLFAILAAQGYFNAYAGIALPNPASVALHERAGFEPLGVYRRVGYKFGAWHDVGWWQLVLRQHEIDPQQPLELRAVQDRADWQALLTAGLSRVRARDRVA
jgi:L-amino acid N-acyltransferase YncA